jgi:hypothetical protein
VGLLDPTIPYVEDLEFYLRMELANVKLGSLPLTRDAYLIHDETITLKSITLKRYYIGVGTAKTHRKYKDASPYTKYFSTGTQEEALSSRQSTSSSYSERAKTPQPSSPSRR